jgi:hypothetical protein
MCQLCKKVGHTVLQCWKRFDRNFTGEEKSTNNAEHDGSSVNTAWYSDTGATDHVTNELDKLTMREKYNGQEHIHTANGGVMRITHIRNSALYTPHRVLSLKMSCMFLAHTKISFPFIILHVITMSLLSITLTSFLVKDPATSKVLLRNKCKGGLYPLPSLEQSSSKCVLSTFRPSLWC